jgi:hypothetical protein
MMTMLTLALTGTSQAAEFDEKLKAPMMKGQAELQTQARAYATKFIAIREAAPEQLIRNSALAREKFDLVWQIQRSIDEGKPLGDLAEVGITLQPNGSYVIDTTGRPEWNDLHKIIAGLLSPVNLERWLPLLVARGFRPEDVEIVREYVKARDPTRLSAEATLPVALSFGRSVRKWDQLKRTVPDTLVLSFLYQRARAASESNRLWVDGLMQKLDAQRGRILLSSFLELERTTYWIPENVSEGIATVLADVRRPDFESLVTAEAKGVAP